MAFTLNGKGIGPGKTWLGASGTETYPILNVVMVNEAGNAVTDVGLAGETDLIDWGNGSGKSINAASQWDGRDLQTFQTTYGSFSVDGWQVAPGNEPAWTAANGLSVMMIINQLSPHSGNSQYVWAWGSLAAGQDRGIGWNSTPNATWSSNSAKLTGSSVLTTAGKCSVGGRYISSDANTALWYVLGDGTTAVNTFDAQGSPGGWSMSLPTAVGGRQGSAGCPADHFAILAFEGMLTEQDFQTLHNDWYAELIDGGVAPPSGALPVIRQQYERHL